VHATETYWEGELRLHSFLNLALDGVSDQYYAAAALFQGELPKIRCFNMRAGDLEGRCDRFGEGRQLRASAEIRTLDGVIIFRFFSGMKRASRIQTFYKILELNALGAQCPNIREVDVSISLPAASQSRDHTYLRLGSINRLSAPHPSIKSYALWLLHDRDSPPTSHDLTRRGFTCQQQQVLE